MDMLLYILGCIGLLMYIDYSTEYMCWFKFYLLIYFSNNWLRCHENLLPVIYSVMYSNEDCRY